jgi:hypothetical protein
VIVDAPRSTTPRLITPPPPSSSLAPLPSTVTARAHALADDDTGRAVVVGGDVRARAARRRHEDAMGSYLGKGADTGVGGSSTTKLGASGVFGYSMIARRAW